MTSVYEYLSEDSGLLTKTVTGFLPRTALIPLKKIDDDKTQILIQQGETVKEGQTIAKNSETSVHASIPGIVKEIVHTDFTDGSEGYAAKIELKGSFNFTGKKKAGSDWKKLESSTLIFIMQDKGVVNTFGKTVPLNVQIKDFDKDAERILAVRLYSEDPSRITDGLLTDHYFDKIVTGAAITAKALGAKGIVFAADSNKPAPEFNGIADIKDLNIETGFVSLDAKSYPNGFMHEIAQAVKTKYKTSILKRIGNRDLFIDVQTAIAVYNAVVNGEPVINTTVHITGDCLNAAAVSVVKTGTTLLDLAKQTGDFKREPAKIVINGMIAGNSLKSLDIPVGKDVKSVAFIPKNQIPNQEEENCIRCGNCNRICPVGLKPESLFRCSANRIEDDDQQAMIRQTAVLCTECALCNSVCPSRIPLSQTIALLKAGKANEE